VFRRIETRELDASALTRLEIQRDANGFRVKLPSRAPVMTPAVYEDLVVVSGGFRSREMFAFNKTTGEKAWAIGLGDDGPSTPACEDRVCVFNTESCTIFAVDAHTGELLWSWYLGDPLMAAPTIANGLVFSSYPIRGGGSWPTDEQRPLPEGASHAMAAFDLRTGELRWTKWIDAEVISAPVAVMGHLYAATFGGTMYQFDQASGELVAARRAMATSAPAWIDGALYFTRRVDDGDQSFEQVVRSGDGLVVPGPGDGKPDNPPAQSSPRRSADYVRYDFQDGSAYGAESQQHDAANGFANGAPAAANAVVARALIGRHTVHGLQEFQGSWVLGLGAANYATMGDALVSYDRQTGLERWSVTLPGNLAQQGGALGAPPASAGGRVVVAALFGEILVVDPEEGEVQRRLSARAPLRTQAIVDSGWIYAGSSDGQLVAIDTGDTTLTGWPTWAGNPARTGAPMPESGSP
jgi:outer membrane protein assembly factor BamB